MLMRRVEGLEWEKGRENKRQRGDSLLSFTYTKADSSVMVKQEDQEVEEAYDDDL
jgi:hypothetical protein